MFNFYCLCCIADRTERWTPW